MADRSQLEDALLRAHARGDFEAARLFADEIKRAGGSQGEPVAAAEPSLMDRVRSSAPMRFVQGMRDPIDAGAQMLAHAMPRGVTRALDAPGRAMRESDSPLLQTIGHSFFADPSAGAVDRELADTEHKLEAARRARAGGEDPGIDFARLSGNVASPANAAIARVLPMATTTTGRAAVGAGAGAAGGALSPVLSEDGQQSFLASKASQTMLGAGAGAVLAPVVGRVGDAVARRLESAVAARRSILETDRIVREALEDVGAKVDDLPAGLVQDMRDQVAGALKSGQKLDAAALLRKADFDALDMQYTRGQITRDPTQFANERNLRGVASVGEPLMHRFETQNRKLGERVADFGGRRAAPEFAAGERFLASLQRIDEGARGEVSAAYKAARQTSGRDLEVPLAGLAQDFSQALRDFGKENIPAAIRARAAELGFTTGKRTKVFSVEDAEELLQTINKHYDPARKAEAGALDFLRKAVKDAVLAADDQGGAFAPARELAKKRFEMHDMVPGLKAAVEGRIDPDDFVRRYLVNGKTNDVHAMADLFRKHDPEALREMREQVGAQLLRAAFGENAAGDALFRPSVYAKTLREIGDAKLGALFTRDEIRHMRSIERVGAWINSVPSGAPVNFSNNSGYLLSLFSRVPGVPTTLSLLSAGQKAIASRSAVRDAMAAKVPSQATAPSAEAYRRIADLLGPASVGAGVLGAEGVR